jgi:hypothetical protein
MLVSPSQGTGKIRGDRALAFLRDGAGNKNLFQRAILPKLTQADREKTKLFCAQASFLCYGDQATLLPDRDWQHGAALHVLGCWSRRVRIECINAGLLPGIQSGSAHLLFGGAQQLRSQGQPGTFDPGVLRLRPL